MKSYIFFLSLLLIAVSCTKDDNEPIPVGTVSRLYISNSDTDAGVPATSIFDPADQASFPAPYHYDSKLPEGNGIIFDPFSGTVFQVSRQLRNIKTFRVNTDGTLSPATSFVDESLPGARGLAYDRSRNLLYVASDIDSAVYVYENANRLSGNVAANKKLKLNGQPHGIYLDVDRLFVVIDQDRTQVQLFESASLLNVGSISPTKSIRINGASRLNGITYSPGRDALVLTDIGLASGSGAESDGAIYIIDSVGVRFTNQNPLISPIRIIKGASTGLGNPVDAAVDNREGKDLIYVAEKASRRILVFQFGNSGNVVPFASATLNSSPESVYLDAR